MLRNLWNKLVGGGAEARQREAELEEMSPEERTFATESVEDVAADNLANERLGGYGSPALRGEREPPPFS